MPAPHVHDIYKKLAYNPTPNPNITTTAPPTTVVITTTAPATAPPVITQNVVAGTLLPTPLLPLPPMSKITDHKHVRRPNQGTEQCNACCIFVYVGPEEIDDMMAEVRNVIEDQRELQATPLILKTPLAMKKDEHHATNPVFVVVLPPVTFPSSTSTSTSTTLPPAEDTSAEDRSRTVERADHLPNSVIMPRSSFVPVQLSYDQLAQILATGSIEDPRLQQRRAEQAQKDTRWTQVVPTKPRAPMTKALPAEITSSLRGSTYRPWTSNF